MKKTRAQKFHSTKGIQIKTLTTDFADMKTGQTMLIATPEIIDTYIRNIPSGQSCDTKHMRQDLAKTFGADVTCPVTTGIYLKIVAEYNHELHTQGHTDICPFWRMIAKDSPLAKKLSFSLDLYHLYK